MKKILLFLFLPSVCFAGTGTFSINTGTGTGTVTIIGGTSGGGAGTITSVNGGTGIISTNSGGPSVTLSLDPNATNYIQNQNTSVQQATFSVVLGTISVLNVANGGNGAALNVGGLLTVDRPDLGTGFLVQRAALSFDPHSSAPILHLKNYASGGTGVGLYFDDNSGNNFFQLSGIPNGAISLYLSSGTAGSTPTGRWNTVAGSQGTQTFYDPNNNVMFSASPSTFTISTTYISLGGTTYNWQAGRGTSGQCLQTDGALIPTLTWGSCSGGGATSFVLLEDGTDFLLEDGTKLLTE